MKIRILFIICLTIVFSDAVNAQISKVGILIDSTFVWAKERATVERVNNFLSKQNVSAYKGRMVVIAGDEEWIIQASADPSTKRITWISILYRLDSNKFNSIEMKAMTTALLLEIDPYNFVHVDDNIDKEMGISDWIFKSEKNKVVACISIMKRSPKWNSAIYELTFAPGTDYSWMKKNN